MRSSIGSKEKLSELITVYYEISEQSERKITNGAVREDRILPVRTSNFSQKIQILLARYTRGDDVSELVSYYIEYLHELGKYWTKSQYEVMLRYLSLGILFEISDQDFSIMVDLIQNVGINDWLFNYFINSRFSNVKYENSPFVIKRIYPKLQGVIEAEGNERVKLLKQYLDKWYNSMKDASWYEAHNNKNFNVYYGYWCLESGVIAKILNLDDGLLKESPYYPYDLVHYAS